MKIKDAIHYFCGYGSPYDELVIRALAKQIPMKPKTKRKNTWNFIGICGNCGEPITEEEHYCSYCGQKLDWRND